MLGIALVQATGKVSVHIQKNRGSWCDQRIDPVVPVAVDRQAEELPEEDIRLEVFHSLQQEHRLEQRLALKQADMTVSQVFRWCAGLAPTRNIHP